MSKNVLILPKFNPRNFQLDILTEARKPNARIAVAVARGGGKDMSCLQAAYEQCMTKPGSNVGYLATSIKQLKKILLFNDEKTGKPALESVIDKKALILNSKNRYYNNEMSAIFFKNGSIIYFLGSDSSAELGNSLDMLVVTESARIRRESWKHIVPSVERAKGKILEVSTVLSGSEFNDIVAGRFFKDSEGNELDNPYKVFVYPAHTLKEGCGKRIYDLERLKRIRAQTDEATFKEDYLCDVDAISGNSPLGVSLGKAKSLAIEPSLDDDVSGKRRMYTSFDIGHDDDAVAWIHYEDRRTPFPVLIDFMIARQTNLSDFVKKMRECEKEWNVHPSDSIVILPFDSGQTRQGFHGSLNVQKEFKKNVPQNPLVIAKKVEKYLSLRVARQIIETGRYYFVDNPRGKRAITILSSIRYKEVQGVVVQGIIDKNSGSHGDHPLDALKTYVTWKFSKLFNTDLLDSGQLNEIDTFYPDGSGATDIFGGFRSYHDELIRKQKQKRDNKNNKKTLKQVANLYR